MIIEIPRLNHREIPMVVMDLGLPEKPRFNLANCQIIFTVKELLTDGDERILIQKTVTGGGIVVTDAAVGEFSLILTPADMVLLANDYHYDIFFIKENAAYSSKPDIFRVTATVLEALP